MSEKNFMAYGDAETLMTGIGNSRPNWNELSDNITVNTVPKKAAGTYTHNGITYVVDDNGRITANGTANTSANSLLTIATTKFKAGKRHWLTGCPEGGSNNTYFIVCGDGTNNVREYGNGVYFTATANDTVVQIVIAKGVTVTDLVFEPMLVLEKHKGETFTSHVPSNKELEVGKAEADIFSSLASDYMDRNGMKNLVQITAASRSMTGIAFTKNADGTITINGTNTGSSSAYYIFMNVGQDYFKPGKYTLSGVGDIENVSIKVRYNTGSNVAISIINSTTPTDDFEIRQDMIDSAVNGFNLIVYVSAGATIDNAVISPMVRLADMSDDTFMPYVPTNKELADRHLYRHTISFQFVKASKLYELDPDTDMFVNGDYSRYIIGIQRNGINEQWKDLFNDDLTVFNNEEGYADDYITDFPVTFSFLTHSKDPITTFSGLLTIIKSGKCISLIPDGYNNTSTRPDRFWINLNRLFIHIPALKGILPEFGIGSFTNYTKPEIILTISDAYKPPIEKFTDEVSIWL